MELLEFAHGLLRQADPSVRAQAAGHLDALASLLTEAMEVWKTVDTNKPVDKLGSLVAMVEPAIVNKLYALSLDADRHLKAFCTLAGPAAASRATMPPHLVETAFWQLKQGETLADRVATNLSRMTERVERIKEMRAELASGEPARMAA